MEQKITHAQYKDSSEAIRIIRSIEGNEFALYNEIQKKYFREEIDRHTRIVNLYNAQRHGEKSNKLVIYIDVPVELRLMNYRMLFDSVNIRGIAKFRLNGYNEFVYGSKIEHRVDIDYPKGFFIVDDIHMVDRIMVPQYLKQSELENIFNMIKKDSPENFDTSDTTAMVMELQKRIKDVYLKTYEL